MHVSELNSFLHQSEANAIRSLIQARANALNLSIETFLNHYPLEFEQANSLQDIIITSEDEILLSSARHQGTLFENFDEAYQISSSNSKKWDTNLNFSAVNQISTQEWVKNRDEWHKESHPLTKNNDGTPKVLYHGTKADFTEFKLAQHGYFGSGIYLTEDHNEAGRYAGYAKGNKETENIIPVYTTLKKPLLIDVVLKDGDEYANIKGEFYRYKNIPHDAFEGYDGLYIHYKWDDFDQKNIVVFSPSQIKSIFNRGTFDPENTSILYQPVDYSDPLDKKLKDLAIEAEKVFKTIKKPTQSQRDVLRLIKGAVNCVAIRKEDYHKIITILLEKGYQGVTSDRAPSGEGLLHIVFRHYGQGAEGELSAREILNIGKMFQKSVLLNEQPDSFSTTIRKKYSYVHVYERFIEETQTKYRIVVGLDTAGINHVVTFHSNKKADDGFPQDNLSEPTAWIQESDLRLSSATCGPTTIDVILSQINLNETNTPKALIKFGITPNETFAVITLFRDADASSLPHELAHYFRRTLEPELLMHAEEIFKVSNHKWTKANEEAFALGFVKYLATCKAPTELLEETFKQYGSWLKDLWDTIQGTPESEFALTLKHKELYDRILSLQTTNELKNTPQSIIREFLETDNNPISSHLSHS